MGDIGCVSPKLEAADAEEQRLISAVQLIVETLDAKKNFSHGARKTLAELSSKLSTLFQRVRVGELEDLLNSMQEKFTSLEANQITLSDLEVEESSNFMENISQLQRSIDFLEGSLGDDESEYIYLLQKAYDVLQVSMEWLEEELIRIILQNRQPLEAEKNFSFRSSEDDSIMSDEESESVDSFSKRTSMRSPDEFIMDLIKPEAIADVRTVIKLMYISKYVHECSQAYILARKQAIEDCLCDLEVEKLSIEEVIKMNWRCLSSKIKRWLRAIKIFVRIYLSNEKNLADQVFQGMKINTTKIFVEASKSSLLQLLNFVEAVAMSAYKPEKLLGILDMYEVLLDLTPDIELLYHEDTIIHDCHEVLDNLGKAVRATVLEFENAITSSTSTNPFAGGGIHHLTRYVMNYATVLPDYTDTLNVLLDNGTPRSPISVHLLHLISLLESNLEKKANLYTNVALQEFFLMNNVYYIAQKVKSSHLRGVFADEWIKRKNWKFQQHAMNYERATWSSILALLNDDGIQNPGSRDLLRERLREFYIGFEDVYKSQTSWMIHDDQLREDLRISTSLKVVQAYRSFVGRNSNYIWEGHIKYSADDLQTFILDLFEGSQKSLQSSHRR